MKRHPARRRGPGKSLALRASFPPALLNDVRALIASARQRVAVTINAELTLLYWQIGCRINEDILGGERAGYGQHILYALSTKLTEEFGPGYDQRNLAHMVRFAEAFPDRNILYALRTKLSWTHFRHLIYVEDPLAREFYAEMARMERWSVRMLEGRIRSLLYERTAISRKPAKLISRELRLLRKTGEPSPDLVFRDPYFLDFLGLQDTFSEKDLEAAIIREMERFILELGTDFAFVARQKRIVVDGEDYHLDLLFYNRRLRRLVAIDLKLGKLQASDKGQMELYLNWLATHECRPGEKRPVGLILCTAKSDEHIHLLRFEQAGIRVAQYMTELPPRDWLEKRLHDAIRIAKQRLAAKKDRK